MTKPKPPVFETTKIVTLPIDAPIGTTLSIRNTGKKLIVISSAKWVAKKKTPK